ncbi:hypothetical protein ACFX5Z_07625 [Aeromonas dhakensis]|uniref:hypothetical protein n=1 Tax=Aeromonas TaxID=642 RepID=UPI001CC6B41B|nr:hypothetical protein [Aeromonas hydrophila]GJC04131.1 hypothetical protein KAM385_11600 [Aeromonas hydrophila]
MHTANKAKPLAKVRQDMVHEGVAVALKRPHDHQHETMKTAVTAEQLDRLAMLSMASILTSDPKNATFSEI